MINEVVELGPEQPHWPGSQFCWWELGGNNHSHLPMLVEEACSNLSGVNWFPADEELAQVLGNGQPEHAVAYSYVLGGLVTRINQDQSKTNWPCCTFQLSQIWVIFFKALWCLKSFRKKMTSSRKHHLKVRPVWLSQLCGASYDKVTWLSLPELDAVHCQRVVGWGGEGAWGGEEEIHGWDLSSSVHAKDHAGAAGGSWVIISTTKEHLNILIYLTFVFRSSVRRFIARLTRLMKKDTTCRWRSPNRK